MLLLVLIIKTVPDIGIQEELWIMSQNTNLSPSDTKFKRKIKYKRGFINQVPHQDRISLYDATYILPGWNIIWRMLGNCVLLNWTYESMYHKRDVTFIIEKVFKIISVELEKQTNKKNPHSGITVRWQKHGENKEVSSMRKNVNLARRCLQGLPHKN